MNIILITVDCLRPDHLSCYGYDRKTSPNVDRLADTGIRFDQAIATGGWTQPGIVSLLTSTYPLMYEGCRKPLSDRRPSLLSALDKLGYATVGFSTNPQVGSAFGYDRGFSAFEDLGPHRSEPSWYNMRGSARLLQIPAVHSLLRTLGVPTLPPARACSAEVATERFCEWCDTADQPFFAWIHYMDAHFPYQVDRDLRSSQRLAQSWRKLRALYDSAAEGYAKHPGQQMLDLVIADYDRAILYVDEQIGVLLNHLEKRNMDKQTAVIVTADHGEMFFEHGCWSHRALYEEVVHVPLVVDVPGFRLGDKRSQLVTFLDVAPTLIELLGAPQDPNMCGQSILRLFQADGEDLRDYAISELVMGRHDHHLSVRSRKHKYIYRMTGPRRYDCELYDLIDDPGEQRDLAGKRPVLANEFQHLIDQHLESVQSTWERRLPDEQRVPEEVIARLRGLGYLD